LAWENWHEEEEHKVSFFWLICHPFASWLWGRIASGVSLRETRDCGFQPWLPYTHTFRAKNLEILVPAWWDHISQYRPKTGQYRFYRSPSVLAGFDRYWMIL
jgi:hypothetical protein